MSKIEDKIVSLIKEDVLNSPQYNSDLERKGILYDPEGMPNSERAIDEAEINNLVVKFPTSHELFVDIDNEHSFILFQYQFTLYTRFIDPEATYAVTPSKSGLPKRHIVVTSPQMEFSEFERVAYQAMLGSDRTRELLGAVQAANDDPHPTLFLEPAPIALPAAPEMLQLGSGSLGDIARDQNNILTEDEIPF
jgi:hypothetical protein